MTATLDVREVIHRRIRDLPPLPAVVRKLVRIVGDDKTSAEDVTRVLAGDQALAGKILKLVNSSFYGQSGEIATITRAVVVLGFAAVRNLALGLAAGGALARAGGREYQQRFWSHALATAAAAETLSRRCGLPADPEEAFVAGLLHDIGHPVLALAAPDAFAACFAAGPDGMLDREEEAFGLSHPKAGRLLLKRWKLPAPLCEAVRFHHNPKVCASGDASLASLVCLADMLACVVDGVYVREGTDADLGALTEAVGLDLDGLADILDEIGTRLADSRVFLEMITCEAVAAPAPAGPAPRTVSVGTDPLRARWVRQALRHHGCPLVPMKAFFADGRAADLVIIDRGSVSDAQLAQMAPLLARGDTAVRVIGDPAGTVAAALGHPAPGLPLVFGRADLD